MREVMLVIGGAFGGLRMWKLLTPNKVTAARMFLGGVAVIIYSGSVSAGAIVAGAVALALTIAAVALDGLDGFLARRMNLATPLGAQLDVLGDRVIENIFFTWFAVCGEISLWVPVIFFVRGALTDFLRGLAASRSAISGRDEAAFRRGWMLTGGWSRRLVASRASRAAYATLKCVCFCALGIEWIFLHAQLSPTPATILVAQAAVNLIVAATLAFCLLRAVPVFWEGRRDFLATACPSGMDPTNAQPKLLHTPARPAAAAR